MESMLEKIYVGKTKDVFLTQDGDVLLFFKDAVTGSEGVIDSGANEVIGEIAGKGSASLLATVYFFKLLESHGLATHFIGVGEEFGFGPNTILVRNAKSYDLEVICREKAWGSFVRRYGKYVKQGDRLPSLVEFTLKDDQRGDPLITEDALVALDIVSREGVEHMKETARWATKLIKDHLAEKGLELIDAKYEFGEADGKIILIDEISGDSMRVIKGGEVLTSNELVVDLGLM